MEICKDICTRYPHRISMFGYVQIHGYMEIHMDNIGYLMDISIGYLFLDKSFQESKKISMYPNISVLIHAFILIYPHILTYLYISYCPSFQMMHLVSCSCMAGTPPSSSICTCLALWPITDRQGNTTTLLPARCSIARPHPCP